MLYGFGFDDLFQLFPHPNWCILSVQMQWLRIVVTVTWTSANYKIYKFEAIDEDYTAPFKRPGILIQILIQICCVYTEANWIQINPDSDHLSYMDCDLDSNPDSGPGAHVNAT